MAKRDTVVVIDGETRIDDGRLKQSEVVTKSDNDSSQDFIAKIRNYNREGPHFLYGSTIIPPERKSKARERRLIKKSGRYNVERKAETEVWDKYLRDFSNTLVNSRWRWTILSATSSFVLSWLLFALIWMLISNANGDLEVPNPTTTPCLTGIHSFAGYFMFSIETQATIGYGSRYINHYCPEGVFIMCLQIILGCAICGLMVNIVYMKMMRPLRRYSKKLFSKNAVICRRDGDLCLIFRVRDKDTKHAVGTTVNAYLLRKEKGTEEPYLETLSLEPYGFLIWPLEIVHKINKASPLWDISSYDLISDRFEIIVSLQGSSPTTGQCTKTRSSYLSSEILWGHRFSRCVKYVVQEQTYVVNHTDFNLTHEYSIHLCSAKRFGEVFHYINPTPSPTPLPPNSSDIRRIEINIIHSNSHRRTYVPTESEIFSEKSEHSSLDNNVNDGGTEENTALLSNSQSSVRTDTKERESSRHSVYDEVISEKSIEEPLDDDILRPKNQSQQGKIAQGKEEDARGIQGRATYRFSDFNALGSSEFSLFVRSAEDIPLADRSPGYDNVETKHEENDNNSSQNMTGPHCSSQSVHSVPSSFQQEPALNREGSLARISNNDGSKSQSQIGPALTKSVSYQQFRNPSRPQAAAVYNLDTNKIQPTNSNFSIATTDTEASRQLDEAESDLDALLASLEDYLGKLAASEKGSERSLGKF